MMHKKCLSSPRIPAFFRASTVFDTVKRIPIVFDFFNSARIVLDKHLFLFFIQNKDSIILINCYLNLIFTDTLPSPG